MCVCVCCRTPSCAIRSDFTPRVRTSNSRLGHSIGDHPRSPKIAHRAVPFYQRSTQESEDRTRSCAIRPAITPGDRKSHSRLCHSIGSHPSGPKITLLTVLFDRRSPQESERRALCFAIRSEITSPKVALPSCAVRSKTTPGLR